MLERRSSLTAAKRSDFQDSGPELGEIVRRVVSESTSDFDRSAADKPIAKAVKRKVKSIMKKGTHLCGSSSSLYEIIVMVSVSSFTRTMIRIYSGYYASGLDMFHGALGDEEACHFTFHGFYNTRCQTC
jgi:hypothetical protein